MKPGLHLTRRNALTCLALATLTASTAQAQVFGGSIFRDDRYEDPVDEVPNYYSIRRFTQLSENQIYKVHLAIKRNRTVIIQGYSASQSRQIIRDARRDWPSTRARLLRNQ